MKTVRRTFVKLALILAVAPASGCTFGLLRESRDPAIAAVPPCYSGDVCAIAFDTAGFGWARDAMQSSR